MHGTCLETWLGKNTCCPVCRADLTMEVGSDSSQVEEVETEEGEEDIDLGVDVDCVPQHSKKEHKETQNRKNYKSMK